MEVIFDIQLLDAAEQDLRGLERYITQNFSSKIWHETYAEFRKSIEQIKTFPQIGKMIQTTGYFQSEEYRQVISGMNRIIYEVRSNVIYIHLICDTRREFQTLFINRLSKQPSS